MDRQRTTHPSFMCFLEPAGRELILRVAGDVDLASRSLLFTNVQQAVARRSRLTIDLTRVSYMDSTGVKTLDVATEALARVTILVRPGILFRLLMMLLDQHRFEIRQVVESPVGSATV